MVVASATPTKTEKILPTELPLIDLSHERSKVSNLITKACENYGFFKVINHGVSQKTISRMEEESLRFFSKPNSEKQRAGPACPFGYGSKNIGANGDIGEVEYLLLKANPNSISQGSNNISDDPTTFSDAVGNYIEAVRELACELLDLMAEGLWVPDASIFSRLIKDIDSDSVLRLNYYPPSSSSSSLIMDSSDNQSTTPPPLLHKVGFGEHSDPQIITILRSNDVGGLQISLEDGVWSPVPPDPTAFWVNVGDLLQAMTNGRFLSVRHRVLTHPSKSRLSIGFFGGPSLHSCIVAPPQFVAPQKHPLYRPFTWAEYKQVAYTLRLGETRLNLFKASKEDHNVP